MAELSISKKYMCVGYLQPAILSRSTRQPRRHAKPIQDTLRLIRYYGTLRDTCFTAFGQFKKIRTCTCMSAKIYNSAWLLCA